MVKNQHISRLKCIVVVLELRSGVGGQGWYASHSRIMRIIKQDRDKAANMAITVLCSTFYAQKSCRLNELESGDD